MTTTQRTATDIKLLQKQKLLEVSFDDGTKFSLPCEYLRVYSPSAEVRGHGIGEPVLVAGKQDVNIIGIDPVGNYAIKLIFNDGHETGIYSFETLYQLGQDYDTNWQLYLTRLNATGKSREAERESE
jgi:DUF971 family protein